MKHSSLSVKLNYMNAWQQQMETVILVEGEIKLGHNDNMLGVLEVPIL
jgi:hypothetical protein